MYSVCFKYWLFGQHFAFVKGFSIFAGCHPFHLPKDPDKILFVCIAAVSYTHLRYKEEKRSAVLSEKGLAAVFPAASASGILYPV